MNITEVSAHCILFDLPLGCQTFAIREIYNLQHLLILIYANRTELILMSLMANIEHCKCPW